MMSDDDKVLKELLYWSDKGSQVVSFYSKLLLVGNGLLFAASLFALGLIVVKRRRFERFIVLTLTFYLLYTGILTSINIRDMVSTSIKAGWLGCLTFAIRFFYLMAHWLFSSQYLRTSKALPILLSQATLEYSAKGNKADNRMSDRSSGFDVNLM